MDRILLFDIDLTLIRSTGGGRLAMNRAMAPITGVEDTTGDMRFDGRTDRGIFLEALGRYVADPEAHIATAMERYLEELPRALRERPGTVLPGVPELLDALQGHAALGLASGNMAQGARAKLEQFDLWERFRGGGFGDRVEERHELVLEAIENVARAHEIAPEPGNAVVIGDTPRDVAAGHRAGARVLGVATGRSSVEELLESGAEMAIEDFGDTQQALELLLG